MKLSDYVSPELRLKINKFKRQVLEKVDSSAEDSWKQEMQNSPLANRVADEVVREWFSTTESLGCATLKKTRDRCTFYALRVYSNMVRFELQGVYLREGGRDEQWDLFFPFEEMNIKDITNGVKRDTLHAMIMARMERLPFLRFEHGKIYLNGEYEEANKLDW